METLTYCPVCNGARFNDFITCKDYTVSGENFRIVACGDCGFRFTNPRPGLEEIGRYYQSDDYISHTDTKKGLINALYQLVKSYTLSRKFQLLKSYLNGGETSILDIGSGTGAFLNVCKKKGWRAKGIEPSEAARNIGIRNYNLQISDEGELKKIPDQSFQFITLWHVLEHVHNLPERLKDIKRIKKEGGFCFIAVPNCLSHDAVVYREAWAAYDLPRHLYHFTPNTMKQLLQNYGFNVVEILPMKFDSFYVSMLSEKYRKGSVPRGIWTGFISNLKARRNPLNYSSLIYVVS